MRGCMEENVGSSLLFVIWVLHVPVLPLPQFWGGKLGVCVGFCVLFAFFCKKVATRQKIGVQNRRPLVVEGMRGRCAKGCEPKVE